MDKALRGIRVLDLTRMYAGPFCSMLLAELGAEVIKVEMPGGGDAVRTIAPMTEGMESHIFVILNRGKRSITLNLNSEPGRGVCRQLAGRCDILLENFTPGTMERFGLGYETLKVDNPGLIYASISGFGQTGPYRSQVAFDTIIQAVGGLISVTGHPDSPPTKAGPAIADYLGSMSAVISILAALQHRARTNQGQFVDISLQDCTWLITAIQFLPWYLMTGREPKRLGNAQIEATPFSIYSAKDGYVVIAIVTVDQWRRFLEVIGRTELMDVRAYASQVDRINHAEQIDTMVEQWTKEQTVHEIIEKLRAADLPCGTVPSFSQVVDDPQLASRNMQVEVQQLVSGNLKAPGSVFKMGETPGDPTQPAPFLGQHNHEVYAELLGFDPEKLNKLQSEGVI